MNTVPQPAPPEPRPARRSRLKLALVVLGLLLAGTILFLILTTGPTPAIVWLPLPASTQAAAPGKLAQLKAKLKTIVAPIWRPFRRIPRQIQVNSTLMRLAPNSPAVAVFGTAVATNSDGLRAWVVDPSQLRAFIEPPDAKTGEVAATTSVILFDGQQGVQTQVRSSMQVNRTNDFIKLVTSIVPKIVSGSVRLNVGVTWAGGSLAPSNANLIACRALLPNGGALVVDCGQAKSVAGKDYWFVFSPVIHDPKAKPPKR